MTRRVTAALVALAALAGALCVAPAAAAEPLLTPQPLLDRETFWDNKDWDWYKANVPFFECPDADVQTTYYYRWELLTKHLTYGSPNSGQNKGVRSHCLESPVAAPAAGRVGGVSRSGPCAQRSPPSRPHHRKGCLSESIAARPPIPPRSRTRLLERPSSENAASARATAGLESAQQIEASATTNPGASPRHDVQGQFAVHFVRHIGIR